MSILNTCDVCGYENESDDKFCGNCGKDFGKINLNNLPEPSKRRLRSIGGFLYLIYWVTFLIVTSIVLAILYFIFGFWAELLSFIITLFIIIGCLGQIFTALFDWYRENHDLKKKRKLKEKLAVQDE